MESMSNAPYLLPKRARGPAPRPRRARRLDDPRRPVGRLRRLPHGLLRARSSPRSTRVTRAGAGRVRAARATARRSPPSRPGKFKDEILPVPIPQKKGEPVMFAVDETPREDTSLEALAQAEAGLQGGRHGDRRQRAGRQRRRGGAGRHLGRDARRRSAASRWRASWPRPSPALEPSLVMMTPVPAVRKLWEKTGWSAGQRRPLRAERGLRGAGGGGHARARARPGARST